MKLLRFTPHGSAELYSSNRKQSEQLWSSDDDQAFSEEFEDTLDGDNEDEVDDVVDYLVEHNFLEDGEDISIEVEDLESVVEDDEDDE